jgi:hypothetical protein
LRRARQSNTEKLWELDGYAFFSSHKICTVRKVDLAKTDAGIASRILFQRDKAAGYESEPRSTLHYVIDLEYNSGQTCSAIFLAL